MKKRMDHRTKTTADGDFLEYFVRDMTPEEEAEYNKRQEEDDAALEKYMDIAMTSWRRYMGEYSAYEEIKAERDLEAKYYENKKALFGDLEIENKARTAMGIDVFAQIVANVNSIEHNAEWNELHRCAKIQSERERLGAVQAEYSPAEFIKKYNVTLIDGGKLKVSDVNNMQASDIKKYIDKHRDEITEEIKKEA